MRETFNDALRRAIGLALVVVGVVLELRQRLEIRRYRSTQARLRRRYAIADETPVLPYGPEQRASIEVAARRCGNEARFAKTSGTTAEPKRILYPAERVARARWAFIDAFARHFATVPWRRHSFYVFSSLRDADSLTSYMMEEKRLPPYVVALQAAYRVQAAPALQVLAQRYGDVALRLWVLTLANPGFLYSTNPSTLAMFLDAVQGDWMAATALVREFVRDRRRFETDVLTIARRITSRGAAGRLRRIAQSPAPLPLTATVPAAHTYVCWTGGYVQPFLDRLAEHLPRDRYRLLPMYSMSTETPETTPCYRRDRVAFIPLADGVLYEFLPEGDDDAPANLLPPHALRAGRNYSMVVSDAYGLRRYQTDDLFSCAGHVSGLPDLRFLRRRSLSYSFTGEKLTGDQVAMVLEHVRAEFPLLSRNAFLTCMPSTSRGGAPHYRLIGVVRHGELSLTDLEAAAARCDALLSEINGEYGGKRASGRLGPMRGTMARLDEFLRRVGGPRPDGWEAQFKFLPLYRQRWDDDELVQDRG